MTVPTLICSIALIALGVSGYLLGEPNDQGKQPVTALIPAVIGALLGLCALIVMAKPGLRKHVMHLAAMVGLFGFLGGFMPIYRQIVVKGKEFDPSYTPVRNGLILSIICAVFLFLCIRSFIAARKAREAAAK
ncbi:hypothetical protein BH11PLA2_BH11PLA2_00830 [soil metagenome]